MNDHDKARLGLAICALALVATLLPVAAHAQGFGGGGQASGIIQWVVTNIGKPALNMGILAIGILCFFLRFNLIVVGAVVVGGLIFANYTQLAGMFGF